MTALVTQTTWDRPVRSRRGTVGTTEATYTVAHVDASCPRAAQASVVAELGNIDEALDVAMWPCSGCIPVEMLRGNRGDLPVDAVEVAEARHGEFERMRDGDGTGTRGPAVGRSDEPSEKQAVYLRSLWVDLARLRGEADPDGYAAQREAECRARRGVWTRKNASDLIDDARGDLLAERELQRAGRIPTTAAPLPAGLELLDRSNRYGGPCVICGGNVADGAGRLAKRDGKWAVAHHDGEWGVSTPVSRESRPTDLPDVPAGHYAVESHGDNDLLFVRVDRPTEGQYAGRTFMKMIVGGHPDQPIRGAHVRPILERIMAAGPENAARLYGQQIGRCARCNRSLTDQESRERGFGPECWGRV
jgi:hypothetical protein